MKILMINVVCGIRSTGRICTNLATALEGQGHEVKIAYGRENVPEQYKKYAVKIGSEFNVRVHALESRIFDNDGFAARNETKRFLEWATKYNPDVLWLHNLHGYYINVELLFSWIKSRPDMQVKWTLHDCWAFTGHCAHFSYVKCDKWKTGCEKCCQKKTYPSSLLIDNSRKNYLKKKNAFSGVNNMTVITPSEWLADLVRQSFLGAYRVEVHNNKVDKSIFKPTQSNFKEKYGLTDKFVVLGVSSVWNDRKGLYDFLKLAEMLDERFAVVLVGLTKKQIEKLPNKILGIRQTNDLTELAEIYSAADLFFNPSKEETFSMTTSEAQACGTTSIVYKGTACEEVLDKANGMAIQESDLPEMKSLIERQYYKVNKTYE